MSPVPTVARVDSLSHWTNLFHPTTGVFRLPSTSGETIEHLDIDLRFVHSDFVDPSTKSKDGKGVLLPTGSVHLPSVCLLTLRGADHCQDSDEAMDALTEVLSVVHPVEVRWLNASNDPSEQLTFATHLVHDAIIQAGQQWAMAGCLRKLVIQGGFPCPNLTAPTPFTLTPATTPASSPGPHRMTFGSLSSALPSLSTTKPKPRVIDEDRLKARAERKRLADYTLKPRFEFAFGSWGAEEIVWRLDGRYTSTCIKSIVEHLFRALQKTWPYPSARCEFQLPSEIAFTPLSPSAVSKIRSLPETLELSPEIKTYLEDTFFFATEFESPSHARLFEPIDKPSAVEDRERQTRRFKADMLLIKSGHNQLVEFSKLVPELPESTSSSESGSPPGTAQQTGFNLATSGLSPGSGPPVMTDGESEDDEGVAMTPDLGMSLVMDRGEVNNGEGRKPETIPARQGSWGI